VDRAGPLPEAFGGRTASGVRVLVVPLPRFRRASFVLSTGFGSVDRDLALGGGRSRLRLPSGAAHFLEHLLFQGAEGDVSDRFTELGGTVNAVTTYASTSFLATAAGRFEENLGLLLRFVREAAFDAAAVRREARVILEELRMYRDCPGQVTAQDVLGLLYRRHPVRDDVAGTVRDVRACDAAVLRRAHAVFYHPARLLLVAAGPVDPAAIAGLVEAAVPRGGPAAAPVRRLPRESRPAAPRRRTRRRAVPRTTFALGFAEARPGRGGAAGTLRREVATGLLLEVLFGRSSEFYAEHYESGLIDSCFGCSYVEEGGCGFTMISGESLEPRRVERAIVERLRRARAAGTRAEDLERTRSAAEGRFLRSHAGPEEAAAIVSAQAIRGVTRNAWLEALRATTTRDLDARAREHLVPERRAWASVEPE
jgi:predicted Zn-dependent peptidase